MLAATGRQLLVMTASCLLPPAAQAGPSQGPSQLAHNDFPGTGGTGGASWATRRFGLVGGTSP